MKTIFTLLFVLFSILAFGQEHSSMENIEPNAEFDNIHVKKIAQDSLQSCFIIWIKKEVKTHYHKEHSENIVVLDGKAIMTLNGKTITVKKGDFINIPKGTEHAVIEILSKKPLKVLSIQSPYFAGKDRVFI